jgi:hypothetical protein
MVDGQPSNIRYNTRLFVITLLPMETWTLFDVPLGMTKAFRNSLLYKQKGGKRLWLKT